MSYTYVVAWSKLNKYYYGIRYASTCNPSELWKTYFSSSKHVTEFRKINGEPDIIQVRKIFENVNEARDWEHKVLRRLKVTKNQKWLNKTDNKAFSVENKIGKTYAEFFGEKRAFEILEKLSNSLKGQKKPHSEEHKKKLSEFRVGKSYEELMGSEKAQEVRENHSKLMAENNSFKGKHHSSDSKNKISKANKGRLVGDKNPAKRPEVKAIRALNRLTCPYCKKVCDPGNAKQWHFENCKFKN